MLKNFLCSALLEARFCQSAPAPASYFSSSDPLSTSSTRVISTRAKSVPTSETRANHQNCTSHSCSSKLAEQCLQGKYLFCQLSF